MPCCSTASKKTFTTLVPYGVRMADAHDCVGGVTELAGLNRQQHDTGWCAGRLDRATGCQRSGTPIAA